MCFKCGDAKPVPENDATEEGSHKKAVVTTFNYGETGGGDSGEEDEPEVGSDSDVDEDDNDDESDDDDDDDDDESDEDKEDESDDEDAMDTDRITVLSPKRVGRKGKKRKKSNSNAVVVQTQGRARRGSTSRVSVTEMDTDDAAVAAESAASAASTDHPGAYWGMSLEEVKKQDATDIFDIMSSESEEEDESDSEDDEEDDKMVGQGQDGTDMRTARQRRTERRVKKAAEKAAKAQAKLEKGEEDKVGDEEKDEEEEEDERAKAPLHVLPLYSMLPSDQQQRVFKPPPPGCRLVVVATNVAETSITIPGIRYVIDAGRAKQKVFAEGSDAVYGYKVHWISHAGAKQRAGRAGRTGPGHCYRLFSSAVFDHHFPPWSTPEMAVMPLDAICLRLKCLGLSDVSTFPFPTPPPAESLSRAVSVLRVLGLLDDRDLPTQTGREVSAVPASPRLGLMLVLARRWGCAVHGAMIVAALSIGDPCMYGQQQITEMETDKAGRKAADEKAERKELSEWEQEDEEANEEEEAPPPPPMLPAQVAFGDVHSDVLRVVNAVGAYEYEKAMAIKAAREGMPSLGDAPEPAVPGALSDDEKKQKKKHAVSIQVITSATCYYRSTSDALLVFTGGCGEAS